MSHNRSNHMWMMAIACGGALLLLLVLPLVGLSKNWSVGISIAAHLIVLYTPLNSLFYFVPLGFIEWIGIIGFCIAGFLVIEGLKYYLDKKYF